MPYVKKLCEWLCKVIQDKLDFCPQCLGLELVSVSGRKANNIRQLDINFSTTVPRGVVWAEKQLLRTRMIMLQICYQVTLAVWEYSQFRTFPTRNSCPFIVGKTFPLGDEWLNSHTHLNSPGAYQDKLSNISDATTPISQTLPWIFQQSTIMTAVSLVGNTSPQPNTAHTKEGSIYCQITICEVSHSTTSASKPTHQML